MDLIEAVRVVRKELLIKDEVLKAYNLLVALNLPELELEKKNTYGMIRHLFNWEDYIKTYRDDPMNWYPKELLAPDAPYMYSRYLWAFNKIINQGAGNVISFGCYEGQLEFKLARAGLSVKGVDLCIKAIERGNEAAKEYNLARLTFTEGDCITYQDGNKYDAVVCFEVIEHVPDPQKLLANLASLTNDKGCIYISTPDGPFGNGAGNYGHWEYGGGTRGHVRAYNTRTLRAELKDYEILELISKDDLICVQFRKKVADESQPIIS